SDESARGGAMSKGEQPRALRESLQKSFAARLTPGRGTFHFEISVPWRLTGGHAPGVQQALSARSGGGLAAAWARGVQAGTGRVGGEWPAGYLKVCGMLVPREMKVEHSGGVKGMTDEEIEQAIEAIQTMLAARAGEAAKVIEGTAEPAALPAPNGPFPEAALKATLEPTKRKPNRLMMDADTTVQDKPRKRPPGPRSHVPGGSDDRE